LIVAGTITSVEAPTVVNGFGLWITGRLLRLNTASTYLSSSVGTTNELARSTAFLGERESCSKA